MKACKIWPTEHTEYTEFRVTDSVCSVYSVGNRFGAGRSSPRS